MNNLNNKNSADDSLRVVVYAGPNGSGKTTMMDAVKHRGLQIDGLTVYPPVDEINPDRVAQQLLDIPEGPQRERAAQRKAVELRNTLLDQGKPFSFETVMSHPSRINELQRLKLANYEVVLTFITTNDPQKNVQRVAQRVRDKTTTGHDVPVDKIVARYERTLDLLPKAVEVADASFIYDNSYDNKAATLQAAINGDNIELSDLLEPWVSERLLTPLNDRFKEVEAIKREAAKKGFLVKEADELEGIYSGKIAFQTAYFLVVAESENSLMVHDKVMLNSEPGQKFVTDIKCRIIYNYKTAAKIEFLPE